MNQSVKPIIYQGIIEEKWIDIEYVNAQEQKTYFYIGVKDVDVSKGILLVDIFNAHKGLDCLEKITPIKVDSIKKAKLIENSYYPSSEKLIELLNKNKDYAHFLEADTLDNNILKYLSDCFKMDNDPYLKESVMINGVDVRELQKNKYYHLDDDQFAEIINSVFKSTRYKAEKIYRLRDLAVNAFSIDIEKKQYVVAYYNLSLNFKNKTLKISDHISINKSFLLDEDKKVTLGMYLDANPDEFCNQFEEYKDKYIELIKTNFKYNEMVNTRPTIFLIEREFNRGIEQAFESISNMENEGNLSIPLKAFFGSNKVSSGSSKSPNIVVFDKNKINIDQMRVVYNAMVNHTTYIKGPPGTGKTETIFNVLLSAYANDKTVLVCSNNNHPVDDIYKKMSTSLNRRINESETEKIVFPIIRLGNAQEMMEAVISIGRIIEYIKNRSKEFSQDTLRESKESSLQRYDDLKNTLKVYEDKIDLDEKIERMFKIKGLLVSDAIGNELDNQLQTQIEKSESYPEIKNSDVAKYAVSAQNDVSFQNYVYQSSLKKFRRLLSGAYEELVSIVFNEDLEKAGSDLTKYLRDENNFRLFLEVFPIVVCTNPSSEKLGPAKPSFDLCIMDEAGQCNVATSLIPIVRANNLLLVGDTNQLQPVTVLEGNINEKYMEKYNIKKEYNYIKNSILSTMLAKDKNSKTILLSYHYRCGTYIAGFSNARYYQGQLKLLNQNPGHLKYYEVKNLPNPEARNSYIEEAATVVELVKKLNYKDVGIITPFVNQANLINQYLKKNNITEVTAGTIHTLQGSEKSTIIISSAISLRTSRKTMDWIANNHELINVAVTRAKDNLYFVGDKQAIDTLSAGKDTDLKSLSDYIYTNGECEIRPSSANIIYDFSNNSASEKEFFDTITPYFNKKDSKFKIDRNVSVRKTIKNADADDYNIFGQKEFDVVIQIADSSNRYRPIVVFEIDGGEHIGSKETADRDRKKEAICKKYGIKLIRIDNNSVKDYELIIRIFEATVKNIPDIEYSQISLFDEDI